jgi:hypothetical protein
LSAAVQIVNIYLSSLFELGKKLVKKYKTVFGLSEVATEQLLKVPILEALYVKQ